MNKPIPSLINMPIDVIGILQTFLNYKDFKNLLSISKSFKEGRKRFFYYKLTKESSLQYYSNENFRKIINNKVNRTNKQISIDLSYCDQVTNVDVLKNVHSLNLSWCYGVTQVDALCNVNILNLSFCDGITDVVALGTGTVCILNLNNCDNIIDVSTLGTVHTLNLSGCDSIIDVSKLGTVYALDLSDCKNIRDVSNTS